MCCRHKQGMHQTPSAAATSALFYSAARGCEMSRIRDAECQHTAQPSACASSQVSCIDCGLPSHAQLVDVIEVIMAGVLPLGRCRFQPTASDGCSGRLEQCSGCRGACAVLASLLCCGLPPWHEGVSSLGTWPLTELHTLLPVSTTPPAAR